MKRFVSVALAALVLAGLFAVPSIVEAKKVKKTKVRFVYNAPEGTKTVVLVGSFGEEGTKLFWNPANKNMVMKKGKKGAFSKTMYLTKGVYQFKFYVDDNWVPDMKPLDGKFKPKAEFVEDGVTAGKNAQITIK